MRRNLATMRFPLPARSGERIKVRGNLETTERTMPATLSLRREQKHQRPPGAEPPVELVVLAGLRFLPFVPTQPRLFEIRFTQRLQIHVVFNILTVSPPDST